MTELSPAARFDIALLVCSSTKGIKRAASGAALSGWASAVLGGGECITAHAANIDCHPT